MIYLHYLIWFKKISSFSDFYRKIVDENGFNTWLFSILDQVIGYEIIPVDIN